MQSGAAQKHIVIVEDEEVLADLLQRKLEGAGFAVHLARDGASGLKVIRDVKPDLVLLDMMLPIMNGFTVLEKMKEEGITPAMPVLIISNSGQPIELDRALNLGVRDYLVKVNFDPAEVLARAESILAREEKAAAAHGDDALGRSVLIVEDDFFLVDLLERKFLQEGYGVRKAYDIGHARRFLESGEYPDVILLDVVLPGANGFLFLEELKSSERFKDIPVLIISNLGQKEEVDKGLRLGAADYVVKADTSPAEIVEKARVLLTEKRIGQGGV